MPMPPGVAKHGRAPEAPPKDEQEETQESELANEENTQRRLIELLDSRAVTILTTSLTVFVLWGDDLRLLAFPKSADWCFYTLFLMAMIIFFCEFVCNSIVKEGYKGGFFFWLDLIATFSLWADIPWVLALVESVVAGQSGAEDDSGASSLTSSVTTVRTARAVRLVRLIRLVRVVKLYSMVRKAKDSELEEKISRQARDAANAKQAALKRVEASRLGKLLSEMTTRRVIVMVLMMLFVIPFLSGNDLDNAKTYGLSLLFWYGMCGNGVTEIPSSSHHHCAGIYEDAALQVNPAGTNANGGAWGVNTNTWVNLDGWKNLVLLYSQVTRERDLYPPNPAGPSNVIEHPLLWLRIPNWVLMGQISDIKKVTTKRGYWEEDANCGRLYSDSCELRISEIEDVVYVPSSCSGNLSCNQITCVARFDKSSFSREEVYHTTSF